MTKEDAARFYNEGFYAATAAFSKMEPRHSRVKTFGEAWAEHENQLKIASKLKEGARF